MAEELVGVVTCERPPRRQRNRHLSYSFAALRLVSHRVRLTHEMSWVTLSNLQQCIPRAAHWQCPLAAAEVVIAGSITSGWWRHWRGRRRRLEWVARLHRDSAQALRGMQAIAPQWQCQQPKGYTLDDDWAGSGFPPGPAPQNRHENRQWQSAHITHSLTLEIYTVHKPGERLRSS